LAGAPTRNKQFDETRNEEWLCHTQVRNWILGRFEEECETREEGSPGENKGTASSTWHEIAGTYEIAAAKTKLKPTMSRVYPERKWIKEKRHETEKGNLNRVKQ
jgi:hypothetical protein